MPDLIPISKSSTLPDPMTHFKIVDPSMATSDADKLITISGKDLKKMIHDEVKIYLSTKLNLIIKSLSEDTTVTIRTE